MHATRKLFVVVMVLVVAVAAFAGKGDYNWERWQFPGNLECSIRYDSDGDGNVENFDLVSSEGFFTFKAGNPRDYVVSEECDWSMVFRNDDGVEINLRAASFEEYANSGWKENYYIYPESRCLKYLYEGEGTWCGYDSRRDVYFWGTWSTMPQGKPYVIDYIFADEEPSMQGLWTIMGCSDGNCGFEGTQGDFIGQRLSYSE